MSLRKALVWIAGAWIVTLPLTGCLNILMSGGVGNTIKNTKPAPDIHSSKLVAKRMATQKTIEANLDALEISDGPAKYATSTHDRCYKGQNNYKVQDGYAYRCTFHVTRYYGMNGDFRAQMMAYEKLLRANGWRAPTSNLEKIMTDFYDWNYNGQDPTFRKIYRRRFLVSDLPRPYEGYRKDNLVLFFDYAERETTNLLPLDLAQQVSFDTLSETYDRKDLQNTRAVFEEITKTHQYVVLISIQGTYFQN
jgi:hypothetical protein